MAASPAAAMVRVVVTRRLPASAMALFAAHPSVHPLVWDSDEPIPPATLREYVGRDGGAHALVCLLGDAVTADVLAASPLLRGVATMSVGYNHVDVRAAVAAGVRVGYTPGVLTEATADLVLALTLATARHIVPAAAAVRSGGWTSWKPMWLTGKELSGSTVGVIGLGRIGQAVARRLRGFGCKLLYSGASGPKPKVDAELGCEWRPLDALLAESDFVIAVCALTPATTGLLTHAKFSLMKPDAVFINASRGETVVQADLARILRERPAMSAGLDVTSPEPLPLDSELLALDNCLVLPHIGSASTVCRTEMASISVENALAAALGRPMPYEVPETAAGVK